MATSHLLSIDDYLHTFPRPDVDYVDGQIEERHLGEYDHAKLQTELLVFFHGKFREWKINVLGEVRVQVSPTRFRVPDICVLAASAPREQIIRTPPLLCIEVLSPEDTLPKMRRRVQDYLTMGVPEVWILDPAARSAYICTGDQTTLATGDTLALKDTPILLSPHQIFSALD